MRVLVTGGAGFIGAHVARALVLEGHTVTVADDLSGGHNVVEGLEAFYALDLARDSLRDIIAFAPEIVFHAAACAREGASVFDPAKIVRTNAMASARLFEAAITGRALKRIAFCSSMARFGDGNGKPPPFDESYAPHPIDPYGAAKVCVEHVLRMLADVHGFKAAILVPHNVFGPLQSLRDRFRNVCGITMNRIMRGEPVIIFGDGKQRRAFSTIQDSLPCFVRACFGAIDGLCVNIGGRVAVTINDLVAAVKEDMGVAQSYPTEHVADRVLEAKEAFCTVQRSEQLLGYEERTGWREGVRIMAAWARAQGPKDWYDEDAALSWAEKYPRVWRRG